MTGEPLDGRMLCDEANVSVVARMERTERDILQRVEVVDARLSRLLLRLHDEKHPQHGLKVNTELNMNDLT